MGGEEVLEQLDEERQGKDVEALVCGEGDAVWARGGVGEVHEDLVDVRWGDVPLSLLKAPRVVGCVC